VPFEHLAVDRHLVAGADTQAVVVLDLIERNLVLVTARAYPPGGLRRQVEKRAQRPSRPLAGAQFQHLAEEHQHDDHGGHLVVDADRAGWAAERHWEYAGG
jgi:hypothetical protein